MLYNALQFGLFIIVIVIFHFVINFETLYRGVNEIPRSLFYLPPCDLWTE